MFVGREVAQRTWHRLSSALMPHSFAMPRARMIKGYARVFSYGLLHACDCTVKGRSVICASLVCAAPSKTKPPKLHRIERTAEYVERALPWTAARAWIMEHFGEGLDQEAAEKLDWCGTQRWKCSKIEWNPFLISLFTRSSALHREFPLSLLHKEREFPPRK